jgi:hypothetical protein
MWCGYEVPIPVYLELTERVKIRSSRLEQLCTEHNNAATVGNVFGTPVAE